MKKLIDRFGWRLFWSALLTVVAFLVVQPLTLASNVPEVARVLPALAVLYWLDLSLFIGRVIFSPKVDAQKMLNESSPSVAAVLLTVNNLFRLGALLWIIYAV